MKKLVYLTLVVVLALVLAGCGRPTPETVVQTVIVEKEGQTIVETVVVEKEVVVTATPEPQKKVTLTYLVSQDWTRDAEMELAKQFEEETGIHIDFQIVPADQYFNVLTTKLNTGEGTDIFGGQSGKTDIKLLYNVEKNAVPLTDEEWVQRMNPLSVDQVSLDGEVYGLTVWDTTGGSWVIGYNKQIFADLGLSVPTTYAEFKAVSQAILDAGITPIYEPVSDGWHHVLWFLEVGPAYEAANPGLAAALNANETKFADDPTMLRALQQLQEMYALGYFGEDALSNTFADTEKAMASGEYAMTVNRLALGQQVAAAYPEVSADTFGYFVLPLADNQIWNVNPAAPSKFIYSGSKNIDAAKAYFAYLTQPENLQYFLDNEPAFTMLSFEGVDVELSPEQQAFIDTYTEQGTVYQTAVNYVNPQWMDIGKDLTAMFTGAATPEDLLNSIDRRRTDMATTAKDPAW
jgi:raffinose/stachyose/melibiose transport system substrate-binding protein